LLRVSSADCMINGWLYFFSWSLCMVYHTNKEVCKLFLCCIFLRILGHLSPLAAYIDFLVRVIWHKLSSSILLFFPLVSQYKVSKCIEMLKIVLE
ncbi:hypothetical protein L9F63_027204, partial [Diploptera punctata]